HSGPQRPSPVQYSIRHRAWDLQLLGAPARSAAAALAGSKSATSRVAIPVAPGMRRPITSSTQAFHTTRWTLVRNARGESPEARQALSELCATYYAPVVAFFRREGRDDDPGPE